MFYGSLALALISVPSRVFALGEGAYPEKADAEKAALQVRVNRDISQTKPADVYYYTVNPMSNIRRTAFTYPEDGVLGGSLNVIAAKGEFEPASFELYSPENLKGVSVSVSPLTDGVNSLPADCADVSVVKVWVQAGCAWYSYFADPNGRVLVPELLVHDENLIRTDTKKYENYVRDSAKNGDEYVWISSPTDFHVEIWGHRENIRDAEKLVPFELVSGEMKQLWITVHVPENAAAGLYKGTVTVSLPDGKTAARIPLSVRVLPFRLPAPKTNYDLTRDFYTSSYCNNNLHRYVKMNGGNPELAEKRLRAEYEGYRDHNLMNVQAAGVLPEETRSRWNEYHTYFRGDALKLYKRQLELFRDAGLDTKTLFDPILATANYSKLPEDPAEAEEALKSRIADWKGIVEETLPLVYQVFGKDSTLYCFGYDEPDMPSLRRQRPAWKYLHEKGLKIYSTGQRPHLLHAGFNEDFVNIGGQYDTETARIWHAMGVRVQTYAKPHTGPENPDFSRRNHGFDLYLQDFDGTNNYMVCGNDWGDFTWAASNYRAFNFVYPASDRFVTTLQFEGFREGIDDVKYATLLRMTAENAIRNGNVDEQYQGKAALQWLIQVDSKSCSLNTLRLEMTDKIMGLAKFLPENLK